MGIYVWGIGCGASELIEKGLAPESITAFVDRNPPVSRFLNRPVLLPAQLDVNDCDLLIVTIRHTEAVCGHCAALGLPEDRILYLKNSLPLSDRNRRCTASKALLGDALLERLLPRYQVIPQPSQLSEPALPPETLEGDYVRLATLELLTRQLETVPGAAAELGVYRGRFAGAINQLLPQRKLYLFDSFQGFAPETGASAAFQAAHRATSVHQVRSILPHPEQAVFRPGFFPASLDGLEERFCLVSLDVDFFQTTLEGLRYFWPRLSPGGFLLLHDWGNPGLPEVAQALERYRRELGGVLPAVPLPDRSGTLVLCKP